LNSAKPMTAFVPPGRRDLPANITAGLLSSLVTICYAISYGSMIFSGNLARFLHVGMPAALVSCVVVALVVALSSSLPFAIAGPDSNAVAVLVGVAAGVAADTTAAGATDATVLATVLASLALSSLLTGALLFLLGVSRRSTVIQFLPFPVIGGFLAGTGYLILAGAFSVLTAHSLQWSTLPLLLDLGWLSWLPPLVVCATLLVLSRKTKSFALVPTGIGVGLLVFFGGLELSGISTEQARASGLLFEREPLSALQLPLLLTPGRIEWAAIVAHLPEFLVVASVSALTVLLNTSGVGIATGYDTDFNVEMRAAGLANLLAGLAGGIVGYQSMNRTMLNHRAGATGRASGIAAALGCLAVITLFPGLIAWFPRPVLVGLQLYLAVGLLHEWLFATYRKLGRGEYLLIPLIVVVIVVEGVVAGVALGVIAACVLFVVNYGRIGAIRNEFDGRVRHSNVQRSIEDSERLLACGPAVVGACLQGFLFFGTANSLLARIRERLAASVAEGPRFVVLDFRQVNGLDASTLASFLKLKQRCAAANATLVLTALPADASRMLTRSRMVSDHVHAFDDLDAGLEWIEDAMLATLAPAAAPHESRALGALLPYFTVDALARLNSLMEQSALEAGELLFARGDPGVAVYLVESGRVTVSLPLEDGKSMRLRSFGAGTIVGEMAFYTRQPRSADVRADEPTVVRRLTLAALHQLEVDDGDTARQFHHFIVNMLASRLSIANEAVRAAY
jgi:sulfate permease, SulP family